MSFLPCPILSHGLPSHQACSHLCHVAIFYRAFGWYLEHLELFQSLAWLSASQPTGFLRSTWYIHGGLVYTTRWQCQDLSRGSSIWLVAHGWHYLDDGLSLSWQIQKVDWIYTEHAHLAVGLLTQGLLFISKIISKWSYSCSRIVAVAGTIGKIGNRRCSLHIFKLIFPSSNTLHKVH